MEGLYIIIGALIGLFGSMIGSSMQNEHQEQQNRKQMKFSLIIEWIDNRDQVGRYSSEFHPRTSYDKTFKFLIAKTEIIFPDDEKVREKCDCFRDAIKYFNSDKTDLETKYTALVSALCNNIGISPPG